MSRGPPVQVDRSSTTKYGVQVRSTSTEYKHKAFVLRTGMESYGLSGQACHCNLGSGETTILAGTGSFLMRRDYEKAELCQDTDKCPSGLPGSALLRKHTIVPYGRESLGSVGVKVGEGLVGPLGGGERERGITSQIRTTVRQDKPQYLPLSTSIVPGSA